MIESELLTPHEAAKYLRLSPRWGHSTVNRWAREGKLKAYKVGDQFRFEKVFIDDMLEKSLRR